MSARASLKRLAAALLCVARLQMQGRRRTRYLRSVEYRVLMALDTPRRYLDAADVTAIIEHRHGSVRLARVFDALLDLEANGHVMAMESMPRRLYQITSSGRRYLTERMVYGPPGFGQAEPYR
jgi:hypothetical protein